MAYTFIGFLAIAALLPPLTGLSLERISAICSPAGCYDVVEKLGEGASGTVYAVKNSAGHAFALKIFPEEPSAACREYEIGSKLNHPNIIQVFDLFKSYTAEDVAKAAIESNVLLELVYGTTLEKNRFLCEQQALQAAWELVDGLKYALSKNLIYSDLHLGNIMINRESHIKIIDLSSFIDCDKFLTEKVDKAQLRSLLDWPKELYLRCIVSMIYTILSVSNISQERVAEVDHILFAAMTPYYYPSRQSTLYLPGALEFLMEELQKLWLCSPS